MKKKFKILPAVLSAAMLITTTAYGGVVDYALYTDIVAEINGHPIRSYNINGHTAVVAEDLRGYGFWAVWNPVERTLSITRAMKDGEIETPYKFPEYTPEALTHRVGERAKLVYSTDIITFIAGIETTSYNIGGETIIWMESLIPYGRLVWNSEARKAEFTLSENHMEDRIAQLKKDVEDWKKAGGAGSTFETFPSEMGTLALSAMTGTTHGTSRKMIFVRSNGTMVDILNLLPEGGFGQSFYANPCDIKIDGGILTFITPVNETLEGGTVKSWGDTLCRVDLNSGRLISAEPLEKPFESWNINTSGKGLDKGDELYINVKRMGAEINITEAKLPKGAEAEFSESGITVYNYANETEENTSYNRAFKALSALGLRSVIDEDNIVNTAKQLQEAGRYCRLTYNGEIKEYDIYWSQGNGHRDLNFKFASPLSLGDGDEVKIVICDK